MIVVEDQEQMFEDRKREGGKTPRAFDFGPLFEIVFYLPRNRRDQSHEGVE